MPIEQNRQKALRLTSSIRSTQGAYSTTVVALITNPRINNTALDAEYLIYDVDYYYNLNARRDGLDPYEPSQALPKHGTAVDISGKGIDLTSWAPIDFAYEHLKTKLAEQGINYETALVTLP